MKSDQTTCANAAPAGRSGADMGPSHFIRDLIADDLRTGRTQGRVATRFPPEPNGYLHIGHAKAICIDFGLAQEFGGTTHLRFDDTNPTTEDVEYVEAIQEDIRWLGFSWDALFYASDYFEELYQLAVRLIRKGKAYVDSLQEEEIRHYRGDYFRKGMPSPYRERAVAENLDLFARMRQGEFPEGAHVLRAKIDVESQNMNLRDPILYRIRYAAHHRTGTSWCIYPMYDFAHPLSDAIERITHSICTLEFAAHRPLYDWCIAQTEVFASQQIEFARLNLAYTVMSKRKLLALVQQGLVCGWDDPRLPTLAGLRRRGYTPEAIRTFCERIGVAKADSLVDIGLLEYCVREDLNRRCPRVMGVLQPLKLVIDNLPEGEVHQFTAPLHPEEASFGTRTLPFSRTLYIERSDFREHPPKDWFRLAPGREVRLRYACLIRCTDVVKDAKGDIVEVHATWDPASLGGCSPDGRAVRGTLHWVSAEHAVAAEVRLYDRLFTCEAPGSDPERDFILDLNPHSLETVSGWVEPYLAQADHGARYQFERLGYFCIDPDSRPEHLVFNRTVTLKDTWAKIEAKGAKAVSTQAREIKNMTLPKTTAAPTPPSSATASTPAAPAAVAVEPVAAEITIEDFARVDLRVGVVRQAELVPEAKKLLRLQVDLGEGRWRQILAGLRSAYPDPSLLVGQQVLVVANLKPRQMKFGLSEGMVLAGGGAAGRPQIATIAGDGCLPGDKVS